jgi:hypothetical protein
VIRSEFLVDAVGFHKIQGRPFKVTELVTRALALLNGKSWQEPADTVPAETQPAA